jgi:hypothetical protein
MTETLEGDVDFGRRPENENEINLNKKKILDRC